MSRRSQKKMSKRNRAHKTRTYVTTARRSIARQALYAHQKRTTQPFLHARTDRHGKDHPTEQARQLHSLLTHAHARFIQVSTPTRTTKAAAAAAAAYAHRRVRHLIGKIDDLDAVRKVTEVELPHPQVLEGTVVGQGSHARLRGGVHRAPQGRDRLPEDALPPDKYRTRRTDHIPNAGSR